MPRSSLSLDAAELRLLKQWSQANGRLAERSRIVLLSASQRSAGEIAAQLGVALPTVYKWRKRFTHNRLAGLQDLPRPGQPRKLREEQRQMILTWTTQRLAPSGATWTIRRLARALNVTEHQVRDVWSDADLRPHQLRTVRLSDDPALVGRSAWLQGMYVGPPYCALALLLGPPREAASLQPLGSATAPSLQGLLRRHALRATHSVAALPPQQAEARHPERIEELRGFLREVCRCAQRQPLHLVLTLQLLDVRFQAQLSATLGAQLSAQCIRTNEGWLHAVERWLVEPAPDGARALIDDLRVSLAQHAARYGQEHGATFVWIAESASRVTGESGSGSKAKYSAPQRARTDVSASAQ